MLFPSLEYLRLISSAIYIPAPEPKDAGRIVISPKGNWCQTMHALFNYMQRHLSSKRICIDVVDPNRSGAELKKWYQWHLIPILERASVSDKIPFLTLVMISEPGDQAEPFLRDGLLPLFAPTRPPYSNRLPSQVGMNTAENPSGPVNDLARGIAKHYQHNVQLDLLFPSKDFAQIDYHVDDDIVSQLESSLEAYWRELGHSDGEGSEKSMHEVKGCIIKALKDLDCPCKHHD